MSKSNGWGGKRPGAGRPKGASVRKNPKRLERIKQRALEEGKIVPLDYFMGVLNDPEATDDERMEAAKAGAPYMHPRLQAVAFSGDAPHKTHEQRLLELDALAQERTATAETDPVPHEPRFPNQRPGNGADEPQHGNGADEPAATEGPGAGLASVAGLADDAGQVD